MTWVRKNQGTSRYLKFEAGKVIEGIFKRIGNHEFEGKMLTDIYLDINGEEKELGTSSKTLIDTFTILPEGTRVRIEMFVSKGKKLYNVYTDEQE